jgi:predicted nuclease with RNAse H fold
MKYAFYSKNINKLNHVYTTLDFGTAQIKLVTVDAPTTYFTKFKHRQIKMVRRASFICVVPKIKCIV